MLFQLLISGGCSASFTHPQYRHRSWPIHLAQRLECNHQNVALPAQGNGMISRKVLHAVDHALQSIPAEDILVGIFWSDMNRHEFYHEQANSEWLDQSVWLGENPTGIGANEKRWVLVNSHWASTEYSRIYYKIFQNRINSAVSTCEHVLRTQWYLDQHKVKYFMGTYTQWSFPHEFVAHPEVAWLYKQIDQSTVIADSMLEWGNEQKEIKFDADDQWHLNTMQSKLFTDQIIWPFLKDKNYVV
jgi:hypothetical protein